MEQSFTNHLAFKTAMGTVARTLFPDENTTYISWGFPGNSFPDEVVALMRTKSDQGVATMSPRRSREETLEQEISIVVTRYGPDDASQKAAEERALEILAALEGYCRMTDTTLGGVVRQCFLTSHETDGFTSVDQRAAGWLCKLDAVFTAKARIAGPL